MRQPVPTISNPNFANPNTISAPPEADQAMEEIVSDVVSKSVAQAAAADRVRCLAAIRDFAERFQSAKDQVLSLLPLEKIADFASIDGIDGLRRAELLKLEAACAATVDQLEARADELERDRVANMTEVEKLWSVVRVQQSLINGLLHRVTKLDGGPASNVPAAADLARLSRASTPQMLMPARGAATVEAFGGARQSGVRRIG
jgi:hypothetical protein